MEVANLGSRLSFLNELYLELDLIFADGMLAHNAPETRAGSTPGTVGCQQWQKPAGDLLADDRRIRERGDDVKSRAVPGRDGYCFVKRPLGVGRAVGSYDDRVRHDETLTALVTARFVLALDPSRIVVDELSVLLHLHRDVLLGALGPAIELLSASRITTPAN